MHQRTRHVLAVVAVTTALCADHAAAAAPNLRPQVADLAGRIVGRLTQTFRRAVAVPLPANPQHRTAAASPAAPRFEAVHPEVSHRPVTPFQFRLPPPRA